jgi:hypothetical protein
VCSHVPGGQLFSACEHFRHAPNRALPCHAPSSSVVTVPGCPTPSRIASGRRSGAERPRRAASRHRGAREGRAAVRGGAEKPGSHAPLCQGSCRVSRSSS